MLLAVLAFAATFAAVDARSTIESSSPQTSTSAPLANSHRHRHRRHPVLGPRPLTGVRRDPIKFKKSSTEAPPSPSPSHDDLLGRCRELWRDATLDHFSGWKPTRSADVDEDEIDKKHHHGLRRRRRRHQRKTFRQRYFICDDQWAGPGSPIFFYFGNEADVELYLNATGLMWQSAPEFGAALVFAEHR